MIWYCSLRLCCCHSSRRLCSKAPTPSGLSGLMLFSLCYTRPLAFFSARCSAASDANIAHHQTGVLGRHKTGAKDGFNLIFGIFLKTRAKFELKSIS